MSYSILEQPVQFSNLTYSGIKCNGCKRTSYNLDDIGMKRCSFCNLNHNQPQTESGTNSKYTLYINSSKKSTRVHWSTNGRNSLCMTSVSTAVLKADNDLVCVNCRKLKKQGVIR